MIHNIIFSDSELQFINKDKRFIKEIFLNLNMIKSLKVNRSIKNCVVRNQIDTVFEKVSAFDAINYIINESGNNIKQTIPFIYNGERTFCLMFPKVEEGIIDVRGRKYTPQKEVLVDFLRDVKYYFGNNPKSVSLFGISSYKNLINSITFSVIDGCAKLELINCTPSLEQYKNNPSLNSLLEEICKGRVKDETIIDTFLNIKKASLKYEFAEHCFMDIDKRTEINIRTNYNRERVNGAVEIVNKALELKPSHKYKLVSFLAR